jgi:hypothetical protein
MPRGGAHIALRILDLLECTADIRFEWIGSLRFEATKAFFRTRADHRYSFSEDDGCADDGSSFQRGRLPYPLGRSARSRRAHEALARAETAE